MAARRTVGKDDREWGIARLDGHSKALGELDLTHLKLRAVAEPFEQVAGAPFLLGDQHGTLGEVGVGDHGRDAVCVLHQQPAASSRASVSSSRA